jgi:tRNA1(Val) A37 N6-methylase TrmN6
VNPADYSQPDFFRFGWDSLFLVDEVAKRYGGPARPRLLELGTGSGVVACELSRRLPVGESTLVECQEEWRPHLEANLVRFGAFPASPRVHWGTVGAFNADGAELFDLIVSNPPYFEAHRGRPAPDPRRNVAHRLVREGWDAWQACLWRSLAPGGEAWWLQKDPGPANAHVSPAVFTLTHEVRTGPMRLLCLRRLHVE